MPFFGDTGYTNADADALTFRDENGNAVQYTTGKLPEANILWSPRVGFNWDVSGNRTTQIRGGTGVFTGRPAYVWISNQIGNTGVLTGFERARQHDRLGRSTRIPTLQADQRHRRPGVELRARADRPGLQVPAGVAHEHRRRPAAAVGMDRRPRSSSTTATSTASTTSTRTCRRRSRRSPARTRARAGSSNRHRQRASATRTSSNAVVLKNQNVGRSWNFAALGEKPLTQRPLVQVRLQLRRSEEHRRSRARSRPAPGTTTSIRAIRTTRALGYATIRPATASSRRRPTRKEYFSFGATTVSVFWESRTIGNASYIFAAT